MAEVYEAVAFLPNGDETIVCIKKILPHLTKDHGSVSMFLDEARLAASLSSPNIAQVYDLCVSQGREYFIVMEFVRGMDVSRMVRLSQQLGRRIPLSVALRIVQEMCHGLRYAHEKTDDRGRSLRITHRDISPHNVLLSYAGEVKITDFGIAKSTMVMTTTAVGLLKGKYGYMSPEQARGEDVDHRSDLFNVGIVLYELICGDRCFSGEDDVATLQLMRYATVQPPRELDATIPASLEQVVLKALAFDPADRYQSAAELERDLALGSGIKGCSQGELSAFLKSLEPEATEELVRPPSSESLSLASLVRGPDTASFARSRQGRRRGWSSAGAAALGLALGGAVAGLTAPSAFVSEPDATPHDAIYLFSTDPAGATVLVDGIELAETTPVAVVRPLASRPHRARFVLDRQTSDAELDVTGGLATVVRRTLPRTPTPAEVFFETFPPTEILQDGRLIGRSGEWLSIPAADGVKLRLQAAHDAIDVALPAEPGTKRRVVVDFTQLNPRPPE